MTTAAELTGQQPTPLTIRTVLFDLDGTLADTGPDLAFALNETLQAFNKAPLPYEVIRPVVSHGGMALVRLGFEMEPEDPAFEPRRQHLLQVYRDNIARHTTLFPGMAELLDTLEGRGMNWGVVTNKPAWLTDPLMTALQLDGRAATVVSGDTLPERKPHPAPMLLACQQAGSDAAHCLYVGDAERDIVAGRNAGMHTLVAAYGYIGADERPDTWGADGSIDHPGAILDWLEPLAEEEQARHD